MDQNLSKAIHDSLPPGMNIHGTTVLTDSRNLMVGVLVPPNKDVNHQDFPMNQ